MHTTQTRFDEIGNGAPPSVSVIVPSYNLVNCLAQCIESVLGQTLPPSQVILCDDASTDGTRQVVADYARRYPGLVQAVQHESNVGIAANRNSGLARVTGAYVTCVDGDDFWRPEKLEGEIEALLRTPEARWAYSFCQLTDAEGNVTGDFRRKGDGASGDLLYPVLAHSTTLYSWLAETALVQEVGLFDQSLTLYEDWEYKIRLAARARAVCVPRRVVFYRRHPGSINRRATAHERVANLQRVMRMTRPIQRRLNATQRRTVRAAHGRDIANAYLSRGLRCGRLADVVTMLLEGIAGYGLSFYAPLCRALQLTFRRSWLVRLARRARGKAAQLLENRPFARPGVPR